MNFFNQTNIHYGKEKKIYEDALRADHETISRITR